jgi:hypothetical protein
MNDSLRRRAGRHLQRRPGSRHLELQELEQRIVPSWNWDLPVPGAPAAASAPMGYTTGLTERVVYTDTAGNVDELYLQSGGWQEDQLVAGAPAAASAPMGYTTDDGTARVVYTDTAGNVDELYLQNGWHEATLVGGAPAAASAPFGYRSGGTARVVYTDTAGNVDELYLQNGWHASGALVAGAPAAASAPRGYVTGGWEFTPRVVYTDTAGNVDELYLQNYTWIEDQPVIGAPAAASAPMGYTTGYTARVVYTDTAGNVDELYLPLGGTWHASGALVAGAPAAASAPFGWETGDGNARVVYTDLWGRVVDLYLGGPGMGGSAARPAPLIPNTPARITPGLSASPGGELNSVDSFFALVNRKDSAIASQADRAVGSGDSNAQAAFLPTQLRLDGAAFGVANHTARNIDELPAVNNQSVKSVLDNGDATLQAQAAELFHALNQADSI